MLFREFTELEENYNDLYKEYTTIYDKYNQFMHYLDGGNGKRLDSHLIEKLKTKVAQYSMSLQEINKQLVVKRRKLNVLARDIQKHILQYIDSEIVTVPPPKNKDEEFLQQLFKASQPLGRG